MSLIILDQAKIEINELVAWYAERDLNAAERLASLFEQAVERIASDPRHYPLLEMRRNPGDVRRARLTGFPVYIGYQLLAGDIFVVSVAHTSRRPTYWRQRHRK